MGDGRVSFWLGLEEKRDEDDYEEVGGDQERRESVLRKRRRKVKKREKGGEETLKEFSNVVEYKIHELIVTFENADY